MAVVEVDSPVELKIKHLAVKLKEEEEEDPEEEEERATVFWSSLMNSSEIAKITESFEILGKKKKTIRAAIL